MVKRFREDGVAAGRMRHHLAEMDSLMAVDTTGYTSDPYNLLERGTLWVHNADEEGARETEDQVQEAPEVADPQVTVTEFLKAQLPRQQHHIINSLRTPFASRLMSAKMAELKSNHRHPVVHMSMNRPRLTYFKSDAALMTRVLKEMDIKHYVYLAVQRARDVLTDLGPEVGLVF